MLISLDGNIGSGKTLLLVMIATTSKRKIFSNFQLDLPLYNELEIINLVNLENNINVLIS